MSLLSPRQQSILNRVVDAHIETGQPVGSKHITALYTELYQSSYSPATVRYEMLSLEEKGYLTHPHTSAGRIPTDRGYRYYVDHGMKLEAPSRELHSQMNENLAGLADRSDTFADQISLLLSKLSGQLSLMILSERLKYKNSQYRLAIRGANKISEQQEFSDRNKLSLILEQLENRDELVGWLSEKKENPGIQITIGKENGTEAFDECTIISSQVSCDGEVLGLIALMGPKRMPYSRTVPLVREMANNVSRILEQKRMES